MVSKPTGRPNGRPPKYTVELGERLAMHLSYGMTYELAGDMEGVDRHTIARWMERYPEFCAAVERGRASFAARNLANLVRASNKGNVAAATWLLERRGGPAFAPAKQQVEVTLDVSNLPDDQLTRIAAADPTALPDLTRTG